MININYIFDFSLFLLKILWILIDYYYVYLHYFYILFSDKEIVLCSPTSPILSIFLGKLTAQYFLVSATCIFRLCGTRQPLMVGPNPPKPSHLLMVLGLVPSLRALYEVVSYWLILAYPCFIVSFLISITMFGK